MLLLLGKANLVKLTTGLFCRHVAMSAMATVLSLTYIPPSFAQPTDQAAPVRAAPTEGDGEILFSSDSLSYEQGENKVIAQGNVEVSHKGEVLLADKIIFERDEKKITASGKISFLQKNGDVLFADSITLSASFMSGAAENIRLIMTDDARAAAALMRREKGRFTILEKAVYSPCKPCEEDSSRPPLWQLKAHEVRHDQKQQRIEYKDAYLEFLGIPIAYTPYLSHPDPTRERESGFLAPNWGNNSDLGAFVAVPYFLNISPSADLTLQPIWYASENQGVLSGKYRQRTTNGEFNFTGSGTQANGNGSSDGVSNEFRGHLFGDGKFDIDRTWRWGFDLEHASDDTYLKRYDFSGADSTLTSDLYIEGFRNRNYMKAKAYNFENQRYGRDENEVPDFLATAQYNFVGEPTKHGDYWTMDSSLVSLTRQKGTDVQRYHAKGGWNLPATLKTGEIYTFSASADGTLYYVNSQPMPNQSQNFTGATGQIFPQVSLKWQYPLARKHGSITEVFEPIIAGYLAPNVGSRDKIPNEDSQDFQFSDTSLFTGNRYDGVDRFSGGNHVDYGVKWSVHGSSGGSSHAFLGQSYRPRKDNSLPDKSGLEDHFSDIVGRTRVSPNSFIDLLYRFRLAKADLAPKQSDFELGIGPQSLRLNLDYNFIGTDADTGNFGDREEIGVSLSTKLARYWDSRIYANRRLSEPSGMMGTGVSLSYADECFKVDLAFTRSYYEDRDLRQNDTISLRFELKNLGELSF